MAAQYFGLNIFYSSQDMIKDRAEQKAMFSPLHILYFDVCYVIFATKKCNSYREAKEEE